MRSVLANTFGCCVRFSFVACQKYFQMYSDNIKLILVTSTPCMSMYRSSSFLNACVHYFGWMCVKTIHVKQGTKCVHIFHLTATHAIAICNHIHLLILAATAFSAQCQSPLINPFIHYCGPLKDGRLHQSHATCQSPGSSIIGLFIKISKLI